MPIAAATATRVNLHLGLKLIMPSTRTRNTPNPLNLRQFAAWEGQ
jgi:hypothetical protein